jgi:hypothetical protein
MFLQRFYAAAGTELVIPQGRTADASPFPLHLWAVSSCYLERSELPSSGCWLAFVLTGTRDLTSTTVHIQKNSGDNTKRVAAYFITLTTGRLEMQ